LVDLGYSIATQWRLPMPRETSSCMIEPQPTDAAPAVERAGLFRRLMSPVRWLYGWVLHWADTPYGAPALFAISFAESSFFPIPPDVLQIALSVSRPKQSFYYATVSAVGSVLGGILGWVIGYACWNAVGPFFLEYVPGFTPTNFDHVQRLYQDNAFVSIFSAAFTPIPYKVFTIAAGVFHVSLPVLIAASVLGRSLRFFLVATCIYFFGPRVKALLERYFELATIVLGGLLIGGFLVVKYLLQ
jgi:membrane protein YqaA with SNARE-associated domain